MARINNLVRRERSEHQKEAARQARLHKQEANLKANLLLEEIKQKKEPDLSWFERKVYEIAPKLTGDVRLKRIEKRPFLRPVSDWEPNTKSRERLFASLCEHLFCKYPVPSFLWEVFEVNDCKEVYISTVMRLAKGESLYKISQELQFPIKLTRKMCHLFLTSNKGSFTERLRMAQAIGLGATQRQAYVLTKKTQLGRGILIATINAANEVFYLDFMQWYINNPMLAEDQLDPLIDYIDRHLRPDRPNFTMTGRSPIALLREMERWHRELRGTTYKKSNLPDLPFPVSGIKDYFVDRSTKKETEIWTIKEVRTQAELREEGHRMRHCVFSYAKSIYEKHCSIWMMGVKRNDGDYSVLTIEVRNNSIVQARGPCNRMPDTKTASIVREWARKNKLDVQAYGLRE